MESTKQANGSNVQRWLLVVALVAVGFTAMEQLVGLGKSFFQTSDIGQVNQRAIQENTASITRLTQSMNDIDRQYSQRIQKVEDREDTNIERIKQLFDQQALQQSSISELKAGQQILSNQMQLIIQKDGIKLK